MERTSDRGNQPAIPDASENPSGVAKVEFKRGDSLFKRALRRLRRDRLTMIALIVLALLTVLAYSAPLITTYILEVDRDRTDAVNRFGAIGEDGHILGTDELGRDLAARLLYAGRVSLTIGYLGAMSALVIGTVFGSIVGYFGGVIDDLANWLITTLDSIPALYLLILIASVLNPSAETLILVFALIGWTGTARLMRGQTIALRNQEFIIGARAIGASHWRIIFAHVVPNLISVTAISLATAVGSLILAESALSFLGIGVQPPTPTWGNMLTKAQQYYATDGAGHLIILPGALIFVTVLCSYIIGDGIRDAFDPQSRD